MSVVVLGVVWSILGMQPAAAGGAPPRLANPSKNVPAEWLTTAERTNFAQTPRYAETVDFCRRLADSSDWIRITTFGVTPQGRDLALVIAAKDGTFTPQDASDAHKIVVLVQNCIHAGECAGKDASLMLLRDIAITRTRENLLDGVVLLVMPIFNADGHERFSPCSRINQNGPEAMGWRVTAQNLNLNRDYTKVDTPEMRAWMSVWNAWDPDLHIDNHSTDGGNWQYDLTYAVDDHQAAAPSVARWLDDTLLAQMIPALESDGHLTMTYFGALDDKIIEKGIRSGGFGPRYSTGYAAVRNRPSILVETHALKPYRTRVIGHYDLMRRAIEIARDSHDTLEAALHEADAEAAAFGESYSPDRRLTLTVTGSKEPTPIEFKGVEYTRSLSEVSGGVRVTYHGDRPVTVELPWYRGTVAGKSVAPPLGYIIPPEWTDVIDRLRVHGLRIERLAEPLAGTFGSYRFEDVSFPPKPFEGRFEPHYTTVAVKEQRTLPAGSAIVRLDQPGARLAVHLLEPEGPDSLVSWGFFNAIFEQKEYAEDYVLERLAREMMQNDDNLRKEFEEKVATDEDFAKDAHARLNFFYRRSPYWDERMNQYPVVRITEPLHVRTEPWHG